MTDSRSELSALADEIQSALALVLNWPEKRCDGLPEGELGRVFMDLLAVRNLAQKAEKALRLAASQPDREMVARAATQAALTALRAGGDNLAIFNAVNESLALLLVGGDQKETQTTKPTSSRTEASASETAIREALVRARPYVRPSHPGDIQADADLRAVDEALAVGAT